MAAAAGYEEKSPEGPTASPLDAADAAADTLLVMPSGQFGPAEREPLSEREIAWIAIEIFAGMAIWIVVANLLLDGQLHAPSWLTDAVAYGGGLCIAMGIGWWRMIRHGPAGPPRRDRDRLMRWGSSLAGDAVGAGLLIGGIGALVMFVLFAAQGSGEIWTGVFGGLAALQLGRYINRRWLR